jgi:N6-adenosine-specific RNA methylase IME4
MKQSDLLKIKIPSSKDCVLFMWTTHAFIWDAKELLDEYGFEYKANLVWNKQKMGMGAWLRMQCEFCLVGIKGKPLWDNKTHRDIIEEPRREHSRKPESFYKLVEEITIGTRLEFFSRKSRKGWSVYGNETQKF